VTNYGSVPATSQPYIQTPDGSQVHWSSFRLVNYIIHDGWRVGLTGDYIVKAVSRDELCMVASIPLHPLLSSFHLFHDTDRLPSRSFELLGLELLHQWRSRVLYIFTTTCISGTHPEMPADVGSHPVYVLSVPFENNPLHNPVDTDLVSQGCWTIKRLLILCCCSVLPLLIV